VHSISTTIVILQPPAGSISARGSSPRSSGCSFSAAFGIWRTVSGARRCVHFSICFLCSASCHSTCSTSKARVSECASVNAVTIFPYASRRKLRKIVAGMVSEGQNRALLSRHRVTISPESVTDSSEHGQSSTAWRAVERVAVSGEHAYIYTNALAAIIVPRRAFAGPLEFEEFVRTARGHHEKVVT
jgi:hypothetical protein